MKINNILIFVTSLVCVISIITAIGKNIPMTKIVLQIIICSVVIFLVANPSNFEMLGKIIFENTLNLVNNIEWGIEDEQR